MTYRTIDTKNDVKLSKFLSLILRHQPEIINIQLDKNGWADVEELITAINNSDRKIDIETLNRIVTENDKKRFIFSEDKKKIRANQGHSIDVDIELKELEPPEYLYHGTATRFTKSIFKEGLKKQTRQYVHLSTDIETAIKVGERHGFPKVLKILSKAMYNDGYKFYLSENNVWLTDNVPKNYIMEEK